MDRRALVALLAGLLAAGCTSNSYQVAEERPPANPRPGGAGQISDRRPWTLERSQPFPAEIRKEIHRRMVHHGEAMESLVRATVLLDHQTVLEISKEIAATPRLARPVKGHETLNDWMPPTFFDYQDQMMEAVDDLAAGAEADDDEAIAGAFSRLTQTCVGCHSLYLRLPPEGAGAAQDGSTDGD